MLNINRINEVFVQSKLTKVDVAKGCGFTRPTLDGLLNCSDVKVSTIEAFAKFFDKPLSYFFDEEYNSDTVVNGNGSVAVSGNNNVTNNAGESAVLQERVKLLEQLLEEKERLIKVLMEK